MAAKAGVEGRVLIAGEWWEVVLDADLEDDGLTSSRHRRISLRPDAATLRNALHELLHAAEEGIDTTIHHDAVVALAAGLASALHSRPELARWMADQAQG